MAVASQMLAELFRHLPADRIDTMVGTGSAGRCLCELLNIDFINELICQSVAIRHLCPHVRTVIEMGGQDSKIIFLPADGKNDNNTDGDDILDFAMNTNCAAGTGSFLDQQATRLGVNIEDEFSRLALKSKTPPRVAGRCSVFAKSDMIHLQQQATPVHDIIAGLCLGLAGNLKAGLCQGKKILLPVAFCGGVAANAGVTRALRQVFELNGPDLVVPPQHALTGAIGAILVQMRHEPGSGSRQEPRIILAKLADYLRQNRDLGHRLKPLAQPLHPTPQSRICTPPRTGKKIQAFLGIDVGSISTNIVVMDKDKAVLSKAYLMTAGRPLEAVRKGLQIVFEDVGDRVRICGVATTGSGRYLTGDFAGADLVINEITAQATGAAIVDPTVDTIFEIGGQDSKFISLEDGVVVDFEMNHACAAGTGSFLEEQAERLGISIEDEFAGQAFASNAPIRLGERCTVFMESDLLSYQQQGAQHCDLVAGLAYSIVTNYLNRVVGHRKIGQRIFFQGGTAFNRAVVAAFEAVTGKEIIVPDHHEVTGALGAAELVRRYMDRKIADSPDQQQKYVTKFRGFDLSRLQYKIRTFQCKHCPNNCEIKQVNLTGSEVLYYGSRCDRYNLSKQHDDKQNLPDLFSRRQKMLEKYARLTPADTKSNISRDRRPTIGIPMCLSNYQLLPLWGTFFDELGFNVVTSGQTTREIIQIGAQAVLSQTCFPVKVAHGHIIKLTEMAVDYIWLPSIVSMPVDYPENQDNQLCPYVQTIGYQARLAIKAAGIELNGSKNRLLDLHLRFQEGLDSLRRSLRPLAAVPGLSKSRINRALDVALAAQRSFEQACRDSGRKVLDSLGTDQKACVIVSRPYNGCDPAVCLDLPEKLRNMNVLAVPMDFLNLSEANITEPDWQANMYWKYGQFILRAGHIIRDNPNLNAIYLSNFSCGPDSFIIPLFKQIMTISQPDGRTRRKPSLVLEIDEHSADAGVITRLEAFHESLKSAHRHHRRQSDKKYCPPKAAVSRRRDDLSGRTLYIPVMGDHCYALAAAFRHCGQDARVLPAADEETLRWGRKYTSGKECLPCIITTGDMLKKINQDGFEPQKSAFFMPSSSGPCRFGLYNCFHRLLLRQMGLSETISVISPNQDSGFYSSFKQFKTNPVRQAFTGIAAVDLLFKTLLRIRPYECSPGTADEAYRECLGRIVAALDSGSSFRQLVKQMRICAEQLAEVAVDYSQVRPLVSVVGEIYVRSHVFANDNIVRRLERLGAEVDLAGFNEWLYYTNLMRKLSAQRRGNFKAYTQNLIKGYFQHKIEKRLAEPLERYFGSLAEGGSADILKASAAYLHKSFEGEAVLSVGKIVETHHHGAAGAVNVGPFTCMPSTIVAAVTRQLSIDCNGLPIINVSYDGQQDPMLRTRLEAFMHQVQNFSKHRCGSILRVR